MVVLVSGSGLEASDVGLWAGSLGSIASQTEKPS